MTLLWLLPPRILMRKSGPHKLPRKGVLVKKKKKNQPTGEALPGVQNRRKSHVVSGRWATKEKDQSECL